MKRAYKLSDVGLGIGYAVLTLALVVASLALYNKSFADSVDVTLEADTIGSALTKGSDVKVSGVPVGRVSAITPTADGARLTLALDPETAKTLPRATSARLLPKTLFGERYVVLLPSGTGGRGLSDGDTIQQDRSVEAVELEKLFDKLLPLLQTLQPDKLAASLGELSAMLAGQGEAIGDSMVHWSKYLTKLNPLVPTMTEDFARLAQVADDYDRAMPDLLEALDNLTVNAKLLVDQKTNLRDVYSNVITAANESNGWLEENRNTIEILSEESRTALEAVRPYATQFPCMFRAVTEFIPVMDRTLGKGTDEPGLHVRLNVEPSRGKYLAGKDAPVFGTGGKPRCPYITGDTTRPRKAEEPNAIPAPRNGQLTSDSGAAARGLGAANSPEENQLVAELMAPTIGLAPQDYPQWASLLVGPVLRNTKVIMR